MGLSIEMSFWMDGGKTERDCQISEYVDPIKPSAYRTIYADNECNRLDRGIMVMTSTNMKFIISRSSTMKVCSSLLFKIGWTKAGLDTKEEDLTHPEDIEHFRKHDEMDAAAERQQLLDEMQIVEANIPQKFRRS